MENQTKKCKYCRSDIDVKAKICPNCRKQQSDDTLAFLLIGFGLFIFFNALILSIDGNSPISNYSENGSDIVKTNEKFTLLESNGYTDNYGYSYYIEGTIQNNTNKEYSYVQVEFNLYNSEGVQIGSALANINNLEAQGQWKFKAIELGGNANEVASYKLKEITEYAFSINI